MKKDLEIRVDMNKLTRHPTDRRFGFESTERHESLLVYELTSFPLTSVDVYYNVGE